MLFEDWADGLESNASPTYPNVKPRERIDYILLRPAAQWRIVSTSVIEGEIASDHCAVVAELQLVD